MNETAFVLALVVTLGYYAYSAKKQRSGRGAGADCPAKSGDPAVEERGKA